MRAGAADGPAGSVGFDMVVGIHHWVGDSIIRVQLPEDMPFLASAPIVHAVGYDDGNPAPVVHARARARAPCSTQSATLAARCMRPSTRGALTALAHAASRHHR